MEKKKEYIKPQMIVYVVNVQSTLLSSSSSMPDDRNEDCENPWWCDNQPSPDDWWGK